MQTMNMNNGNTVLWSQVKETLTSNTNDNVIIPQGMTVILDEDVSELGTLAVNGKLVFAD